MSVLQLTLEFALGDDICKLCRIIIGLDVVCLVSYESFLVYIFLGSHLGRRRMKGGPND
jgi:hypothetical protein